MEWTNWYGNQRCAPRAVERPRSEEEVRAAMRRAAAAGLSVRIAGAGHSNVPLATTDGMLLDLGGMRGLVSVDRDRRQATLLPGTTIAEVGELLWEHGLSLRNQGDIDTQHLAGAVGTGTHGTGRELTSLSGAVVGARIVLADGSVVEAGPDDPELLRAARTSLGVLGAMTAITLDVTDAYCLQLRFATMPWEAALARWDELLAAHRHVTFYWCPTARSGAWLGLDPAPADDDVIVKTMDPAPADAEPRAATPGQPHVDRCHRIFPEAYEPNFHELEYMVAIEHAREATAAVRELIATTYPDQEFPVEVRFVAADDAMLSPFAGRASCSISVSGVMGADNTALFTDCERVLDAFDARAHWGKWHAHDADRLRRRYPDFDAFAAVRARLDPGGALLNDYLRAMLGATDDGRGA